MNHVSQWLAAYHDGELSESAEAQVEAHLAACASCRAELAQLASLSALLQLAHPARLRSTPDQFAAQVALRLPRHGRRRTMKQLLVWIWRLAPAAIVAGWIFLRAATITSAGIVGLYELGIRAEPLAALFRPARGLVLLGWPSVIAEALHLAGAVHFLEQLGAWAWLVPAGFLMPALAGVAALAVSSWLATYFVRDRTTNPSA